MTRAQAIFVTLVGCLPVWTAAQAPAPASNPTTIISEITPTADIRLFSKPGEQFELVQKGVIDRDRLRLFLQKERAQVDGVTFSRVMVCDGAGKERKGWVRLPPNAPALRDPVPEKCSAIGPPRVTGTVGGIVGAMSDAPPPPGARPPGAPIRIGGNIKPPARTKDVRPVYPPIAQSARVQGVVLVEATIGPTGKVEDARVLKSIPLLDAAALDAVRQWEFEPTALNGVPVPVIMTVTVQFTLSNGPEAGESAAPDGR